MLSLFLGHVLTLVVNNKVVVNHKVIVSKSKKGKKEIAQGRVLTRLFYDPVFDAGESSVGSHWCHGAKAQ